MADFQVATFPLVPGVQGDFDAKALGPGGLASVVNGIYDRKGAINKRTGYTSLSTGTARPPSSSLAASVTAGARMWSRDSVLEMCDGRQAWAYSQTLGKWVGTGRLPNAVASRTVVAGDFDPDQASVAALNGIYCIVAVDRNDTGVRVALVDSGGTRVSQKLYDDFAPTSRGHACLSPRVVAVGSVFVVAWVDNTSNTVVAATLDPTITSNTIAGWSAAATLTGASANSTIDACAISSTRWALVGSNATPNFYVANCNLTPAVVASATVAEAPRSSSVALAGSNLITTWFKPATNKLRAASWNSGSLAAVLAPTDIMTATLTAEERCSVAVYPNATSTAIVATYQNDPADTVPGKFRLYEFDVVSGAAGTSYQTHSGVVPCSRPFFYQNRPHVLVFPQPNDANGVTPASTDMQYLVCEADTTDDPVGTNALRPVATVGARVSSRPSFFCDVVNNGDGSYSFPLGTNVSGSSYALSLGKVDFASAQRFAMTNMPGQSFGASGAPFVSDGRYPCEAGYFAAPQIADATDGAAGTIPAGTYSYTAVCTWTDASGASHVSAPAVPLNHVNGGSLKVDVTVWVPFTQRNFYFNALGTPQRVTVDLYRTKVATSGDTTFYYTGLSATYLVGDGYVTFTDNATDASIATKRTLYTTGGILENQNPPASSMACTWRNRVVLSGCDDDRVVYFSKERVVGETPGFNDALTIRCDEGGPITGIAPLDDKLVVFKRTATFVVVGEPYNDLGVGALSVQRLSVETGCIEPRSVITMPDGVMFLSPQGLRLLGRDGNISRVGWPIDFWLDSYPIITSACLDTAREHVRFTATTANGATGIVLVYDYRVQAWTVFQVASTTAYVSSCQYLSRHALLKSDGTVRLQVPSGTFTDDGTFVGLTVVSGWIPMAGLAGFYRARRVGIVGERKGEHNLTLSVDYDNSAGAMWSATTRTWTNAQLVSVGLEQVKVHLSPQKVASVRLSIYDANSGTPSEGYSISAIAVEWAPRDGLLRQAAAAQK